ncbi:Glutamyl-tRNA synthetase class Ib archaeal/eukaryotic cytosolic [Penicillium robsamsonii]|uniref:Glutamyl-tRNA synthetase class Ib archaeal/eukaryotic cytosolic n=1 Tax=Penicillium robsamsonii TaxID=1792511 RepID=UPI0025481280|nr:Glutamyl-tRNA synthetase class Ib archaeal/eukaryotic cytosolic [Penicillium robsamsonii]KAJ5824115.1 Glutamyl-tRNA synthetase class Ib archaeal/eukaryotic cytosolic [Penicillium robsamsonii]
MKKDTPEDLRWYIIAKICIDGNNRCLRDPVIYRCNPSPYHRTGDAWAIYPTYDFVCPIVDSMMLDALNLRTVQDWEFSRTNFIRTLVSKGNLTTLVKGGVVWGWDDPHFPAIRGLHRRGMTIPALRGFILKQDPSKNVILFDWGLIWATNKKYIDPVALRYTAIGTEDIVKATVTGGPASPYTETRQKYVENTGDKDEEITLMNWGNAIVRKISTDGSTDKLSTEGQNPVPAELVDFDYQITKDSLVYDVLEDFLNFDTEFRFYRKGFHRVDCAPAPGVPGVFFNISTGKQK